jgi:hypothetical protein
MNSNAALAKQWLAKLSLGLLALAVDSRATAQVCEEAPIPQLVATNAPLLSQRLISDDGRAVAFIGRDPEMTLNHRAFYVFDPVTRALQQVGLPIAPATIQLPDGVEFQMQVDVGGLTSDGTTLFRTYRGAFQVRTLQSGVQIFVLLSRNEPSFVIDVATGSQTPISSQVASIAQNLGVPYYSRISDISADGRYLLMDEGYLAPETGEPIREVYRLDRQDGSIVDVLAMQESLAPDYMETFDVTDFSLSGDGRLVAGFDGDLGGRLLLPLGQFAPGNIARMSTEPYVLDIEAETFQRVFEFDISQPRVGGSSSGLIRGLGFSGQVFAFDRTGPMPGDPNPLGVARIGFGLLGQPSEVQILLPAQEWLRGAFGTGFARISQSEDRIYFISGDDLTGDNPQLSNQLFSVTIPEGQLRQLTSYDDGGGRLISLGLQSALQIGTYQTVQFRAASFDNTVFALQVFNVDTQVQLLTPPTRQANGRRTVGFSAVNPDNRRLMRVFRCES